MAQRKAECDRSSCPELRLQIKVSQAAGRSSGGKGQTEKLHTPPRAGVNQWLVLKHLKKCAFYRSRDWIIRLGEAAKN